MTWPAAQTKADFDAATDDPKAARSEFAANVDKFNQLQAHVTAYMQGLLDDADAATARTTLDAQQAINSLTAETAPATDDLLGLYDTSAVAYRKMTLANALKVINALTADGSPDAANDYALVYDASASAVKKVLLNLIGTAIDVQTFTANGTWNKPTGATEVYFMLHGPGGSGGVHTGNEAAAGGGGGEYVEGWIDASTLGATEAVVIGAAGAAKPGSGGSANGAAGADSTFAGYTAKGGGGGEQGTDSAARDGGDGGSRTAGYEVHANGASATAAEHRGIYSAAGGCWDGAALVAPGASKFGGGGGGAARTSSTQSGGASQTGGAGGASANGADATAGSAPGGGGGGCVNASTTFSSGAGGAGRLIVVTF